MQIYIVYIGNIINIGIIYFLSNEKSLNEILDICKNVNNIFIKYIIN